MEYVITTDRPFPEIENLAVKALEEHGFAVQQTFSLHSATRPQSTNGNPGYSVFMLYQNDTFRRPVGSVTVYQRSGRIVIQPVLTLPADRDIDADLVAALVQAGLDFCVEVTGSEDCIGIDQEPEGKETLLQDPVCGKRFSRDRAEAAVEYEGKLFYVCCPLCRAVFESDPARYARPKAGQRRPHGRQAG